MEEVRLRFAPSPTGMLHIGGLRTALYNYLYAKKMGGKFILRIEDTDRTRFVDGAIENLLEALDWAGVTIDEGVHLENGKITSIGEYAPYIQSERFEIYKSYIDELLDSGYAYYCFCDKERLDTLRTAQKIQGKIPKYDGLCRGVPLEEARERAESGEEYVIRLKLPHDREIKFHDLVRGNVVINTNDLDDQVLIKSDGFPTYHLAVVIDDHLMKISHIVRGEEWLPSTPKHIFLYEAFGWEKPEFVHLPTVLNPDKKKLSKRQGDVSVEDFKRAGYLPEGLVNYLCLLGWSAEDNREIFSLKEIEKLFSFDRTSRTGGVFDVEKLKWVNQHYIKQKSAKELLGLIEPYLKEANLWDTERISEEMDKILSLIDEVKEGAQVLSDFPDLMKFYLGTGEILEEEAIKEIQNGDFLKLKTAVEEVLSSEGEITEELSKNLINKVKTITGIKGKALFMPLRAAISGELHGPDMSFILKILGKEKVLERINRALALTERE